MGTARARSGMASAAVRAMLLALAAAGAAAHADDSASPVGLWKTVDDRTGKARSLVRIYTEGGLLFGRIERGLDPRENDRVCDKCTDERRGQPLRQMVILRNLKHADGEYIDGDILDPDNGSVYRCRIRLEDGGRKLVVRGFIGVSLFGRSQTWERE
jgi:uncharacterized protein (DUF2147 family)